MPPLPLRFWIHWLRLPALTRKILVRVHETGIQVTSVKAESLKRQLNYPGSIPKYTLCASGLYLPENPHSPPIPCFMPGILCAGSEQYVPLNRHFVNASILPNPYWYWTCAPLPRESPHMLSLLSPQSLLVSNEIIH